MSNKYEEKILIRVIIVDRSLSLIIHFFNKKSRSLSNILINIQRKEDERFIPCVLFHGRGDTASN